LVREGREKGKKREVRAFHHLFKKRRKGGGGERSFYTLENQVSRGGEGEGEENVFLPYVFGVPKS